MAFVMTLPVEFSATVIPVFVDTVCSSLTAVTVIEAVSVAELNGEVPPLVDALTFVPCCPAVDRSGPSLGR